MTSFLYIMIRYLFILLLIKCAFCTKDNFDDDCFKGHDYFTLKKEILLQRNHSIDPCINAYSSMCTANPKKRSLGDSLSNMTTYLTNLLNSPLKADESTLLKIEKTLYNSCMQAENGRNQNGTDAKTLESQLRNLTRVQKWQDLECELFSLGLGYSFFDMKIIPHPDIESVNTILLQPPSLENMTSLVNRFIKVIHYKNQYRRKQFSAKAESIYKLYEFLDQKKELPIKQFFENLIQDKKGLSTDFTKKFTTVKDFNNMPVYGYLKPDKADWVQIINASLKRMNITFETDNIILKNPKYFLGLTMLLHDTPNNIIVAAIQAKSTTNNLAYTNWELYNELKAVNKSDFCLRETKLYGASRMLVHDWVNKDDNILSCFTKGEKILSNIINSIQNEISLYETSTKATFYKKKLYSVFESLGKYVYEPPFDLYENLNVSSEFYFKNIIEYRKLLIHNDLEYLKNKYDASRSFSFIDRDDPQNRFVINTLINIDEMHYPNLPKEVHYGTFGVKTAALIHALLQEDTYNDESASSKSLVTDQLIFPKYSADTQQCIMPRQYTSKSVHNPNEIISQGLALNTAFNALTYDGDVPFHSSSTSVLSNEKITKEQLFFLAYVKDNCYLNNEVLNSILIDNYSFDKAFNCEVKSQEEIKTCMLG